MQFPPTLTSEPRFKYSIAFWRSKGCGPPKYHFSLKTSFSVISKVQGVWTFKTSYTIFGPSKCRFWVLFGPKKRTFSHFLARENAIFPPLAPEGPLLAFVPEIFQIFNGLTTSFTQKLALNKGILWGHYSLLLFCTALFK